MKNCPPKTKKIELRIGLAVLSGLLALIFTSLVLKQSVSPVSAGPVDPPAGYPKLSLSVKTVTPTLAGTSGETLSYRIEIRNTGAYTTVGATLNDTIPANTTYQNDAQASVGSAPVFGGGALSWSGDVGFDSSTVISFSVVVDSGYSGLVQNTATISHPLIPKAVSAKAETVVTDVPVFAIGKTAEPSKPGPNKALVYTLVVTNIGQPANSLPLTVTDQAPSNTGSPIPGPDGSLNGNMVTWLRTVSLDTGQTTSFTFSVTVDDVVSGTVISNDAYQVEGSPDGVAVGAVHTTTVIDPILFLAKDVWPDPPGSNREVTYTLTLLNKGSLATGLVITDRIPAGVTYVGGGSETNGLVSWTLPALATGESTQVAYTVYISDVADIEIVNDDYAACSAEGICVAGPVLTSVVGGPTFETSVVLDPIAKKPGGGGGPVTPTLVVRNLGPGNAIDATALLEFGRISVSANDLFATPANIGTPPPFPAGPDCGDKCVSYGWVGSLEVGKAVTFTTIEGQNTIGGAEGTTYTATVVVTDSLSNLTTAPVSSTAIGRVTHLANLIPTKTAPEIIGRGQLMTYTITVFNSGLSTDTPPSPWLTDTIPASVTVVGVSDGGASQTVSDTTVISWSLPAMSPGDRLTRTFTVLVDNNLVSGTQIINRDYRAAWFEIEDNAVFSNTGKAVTTTVQEAGLIDSYKTVTPTSLLPGTGNVLTYELHIVNSSAVNLTGVTVDDLFPWAASTYQRDAIASSGTVISDIVSLQWTGDVAAFSEEVVTLTVVVDPNYEGPLTNTAIITHSSLLSPVEVQATGYATDEPVLRITKTASPDPVARGAELGYAVHVVNLGQQATNLVITDVVPVNTTYVANSATGGGKLSGGNQMRWTIPVLEPGDSRTFGFRVEIGGSENQVVNDRYGVTSSEGAFDIGAPVITAIQRGGNDTYLPVVLK
jgi:uncharacterized repeat protein (TIGR01451 family)